jgi:hypothetical protein|tara:strand:+ start:48 stop:428 length:381 start_codon:yes stop_codon:yes gene_type:complete
MADKKEHVYGGQWDGQPKIKLKDLIKPSGMEVIPDEFKDKEAVKRDIRPDMILPVDKRMVLKADSEEYQRGLIVTWKSDGGYDVEYWFETPDNIVPAELKGDGKSKGKSIKKVYLGYHPEIDKNGE